MSDHIIQNNQAKAQHKYNKDTNITKQTHIHMQITKHTHTDTRTSIYLTCVYIYTYIYICICICLCICICICLCICICICIHMWFQSGSLLGTWGFLENLGTGLAGNLSKDFQHSPFKTWSPLSSAPYPCFLRKFCANNVSF